MSVIDNIKRFFRLVSTSSIDDQQQYQRLKLMERDIGVPVKVAVLMIVAYFLFFSEFVENKESNILKEKLNITLELVQQFFIGYILVSLGVIAFYLTFNRWKLRVVHWVTLLMNFIDALVV